MTGVFIWRENLSLSPYTHTHSHTPPTPTPLKERPCKHTARRQLFASQEENLHQEPAILDFGLQLLSIHNCETMHLCPLNYAACDSLLWQPELTNVERWGDKFLFLLSLHYNWFGTSYLISLSLVFNSKIQIINYALWGFCENQIRLYSSLEIVAVQQLWNSHQSGYR